MAKVAAKNRNNLIEAAKNGDEDAMETLTIEDIDLYSKISLPCHEGGPVFHHRFLLYACGIECDQYSVIGEIKEIQKIKNKYTNEEIYWLNLECSDPEFHYLHQWQGSSGRAGRGTEVQGTDLDAGDP